MATLLQSPDTLSAEPLTRTRAIERGLPVKMVRVLMKDEITIADLARVIGPRRTLERRLKEGERLSVDESDKLARFMNILELTESIFDGRKQAMNWLRDPKRAFEGQAGLDLVRTGAGGRLVEERLLQLKHGFFA